MEIKVLIFIAFLLISVISSIVRGLKKFNENRPGQQKPATKPYTGRDPMDELVRELESTFGKKKPVTAETTQPPSESREVFTYEDYVPETARPEWARKSEAEQADRSRKKKQQRKTPANTRESRHAETVYANEIKDGIGSELPHPEYDLRTMVISSAILNRPRF